MSSSPAAAPATWSRDQVREFLENLPRPFRSLLFLRDLHDMDAAHKKHRKKGSLTIVIHWDDQGDPQVVSAQASPTLYPLDTPRPEGVASGANPG